MGLADLLYHVGIRYGSTEGQEFASQVMEFVRYHSMVTSVALAKARGPFPAIEGSIYDPEHFKWVPPTSLVDYNNDYGRPEIDWEQIEREIRQHGIRNAAQTTIAPTGTIATVAGCEGYGCEPVFALAYIRHVNDNGKDLTLTYASPAFDRALNNLHIDPAVREDILDQIMREGSCLGVEALPEDVRQVFAVSADISADEHVRMQAAMQAFVDNSLSKTINFPPGATEDDVATAYLLAWKLGCKGTTVYVTGSRDKVVLETRATVEKKQGTPEPASSPAPVIAAPGMAAPILAAEKRGEQLHIWHEAKKPRPRYLPGFTFSIQTPLGKAFVTINENGSSQPFEVFINTSKAGSDTAAVSEAIGRLVSYTLRLASPIEPAQRLAEIIRQLEGIGGGRPLGFGPNRVRSLPDGVAQVLHDYLDSWHERQQNEQQPVEHHAGGTSSNGASHGESVLMSGFLAPSLSEAKPVEQPPLFKIGDLCPECGQAAVINEEGCRKCYGCGYSEC
jgi:ribonucleoside-diphosphate reductase alpha chain